MNAQTTQNDDEISDDGADLSKEDRAAADEAANAAFSAAFGNDRGPKAAHYTDDPTDAKDAAQDKAGAPAEPAAVASDATPAPKDQPTETEEDPFKGLSPRVREILSAVPTMQADLSTTKGRVGALQRENDKLRSQLTAAKAPAEAPAPAPKNAKVEIVRGELPEVADAIDSAVADAVSRLEARNPAPKEAPPTQVADDEPPEERAMSEAHADWKAVTNSAEFKEHVASLPPVDRDRIMKTDNPAVFASAITQFKAVRASRLQAGDSNARRTNRAASAITPSGRGAPADDASNSAHDEFVRAFNSA